MVNLELAYRLGTLFDQKITSVYRASFNCDYGKVQIDVLSWLYEHPGIRASELSERMNTPKQHISKIIIDFEADGLVERKPSPSDRRAILVSLTEAGREFIEKHIRASDENLLRITQGISSEEADKLNLAMKTVIEILEKAK